MAITDNKKPDVAVAIAEEIKPAVKEQPKAVVQEPVKAAPVAPAPPVPPKVEEKKVSPPVAKPKLAKPSEDKVRFLVWFTAALDRIPGLKAHHLQVVRTYFSEIGLGDPEPAAKYDEGVKKFGYGR